MPLIISRRHARVIPMPDYSIWCNLGLGVIDLQRTGTGRCECHSGRAGWHWKRVIVNVRKITLTSHFVAW